MSRISIGWTIFWVIVFWPAAIVYVGVCLLQDYNKKNHPKK